MIYRPDPVTPPLDDFISTHFWAIALVVNVINAVIFRARAAEDIESKPELAESYPRLIRGFLFWASLPWIVMGTGILVGGVPTVWHYFRPQDLNPWVWSWFGTMALLWAAGSYWVVLRDGADTLVRHRAILRTPISDPRLIKLFTAGSILWLAGFIAFLWNMDIPALPSS